MKAYKQLIERKYYKNWIQPTNPSGITATSGWENPTYAFDNNSNTYARCNSTSDYIEYNLGEEVYLTGINSNGIQINSQATATSLKINYFDSDNNEKLLVQTYRSSDSGPYTNNAIFSPIKTSKVRIYITDTWNNAPSRTIQITFLGHIDGTSSDYDFYEDVDEYKVVKDIDKKYYKYIYDNIQTPIFSSQIEAETGINGVKFLTCSNAYQITSTNSGSAIAHNQLVTFDMGEDCMYLESVGFIGVVVANRYPSAVMSNVECSEDNENWTRISDWFGGRGDYLTNPLTIPQPNNYRYLRFTSRFDDERYGYSAGGMYDFTIKYNKRNIIDGTSSDYDFYEDVNVYKAFKI